MADHNPQQPTMTVKQVTPLDMLIGKLQVWVEKMEKRDAEARAQAAERARVPDDIPRFITRAQ